MGHGKRLGHAQPGCAVGRRPLDPLCQGMVGRHGFDTGRREAALHVKELAAAFEQAANMVQAASRWVHVAGHPVALAIWECKALGW